MCFRNVINHSDDTNLNKDRCFVSFHLNYLREISVSIKLDSQDTFIFGCFIGTQLGILINT